MDLFQVLYQSVSEILQRISFSIIQHPSKHTLKLLALIGTSNIMFNCQDFSRDRILFFLVHLNIFHFTEVQLIYYAVLLSAVQQSVSYIYLICTFLHIHPVRSYTHMYRYILSPILFHFGLTQDIEYSSLSYNSNRTLLFIHSMYNSFRLLIANCQFIPPSPPW